MEAGSTVVPLSDIPLMQTALEKSAAPLTSLHVRSQSRRNKIQGSATHDRPNHLFMILEDLIKIQGEMLILMPVQSLKIITPTSHGCN